MERADQEQWKAREVARLLALVETERRYYQEIVASAPVGLMVLSADLSIVSSNREVRNIFGLRSGDPVRGRLDTLLPAWVLDKVREVLASGQEQLRILVQTGRDAGHPVRVSIQPIRSWDDEPEMEALLTIEDVSGITTPAAAGPALVPTEGALPSAELLENLDAIIWAVELPSMRFLYVNDKAQELLGYPAEKWLESPSFWSERIHPEDRDSVVESYGRAIENWSRHSCEFRAQTSYGRVVWLRESARLLVDQQGQTRHLIGVAVDVTQRRLIEEQVIRAQRSDAVGKLATQVSQEIHNLLMLVSGYGEELTHGLPQGHPLQSDLRELLSATDRLRGLANQLSLVSRRSSSQPGPVDLGALVGRLRQQLKEAAGEKINLDIKVFPATIGVQADAGQLEQLVTGLVRRAARNMPAGGDITIECCPIEITEDGRREEMLRPGVYAALTIEDNGPTPDGETRAAMFESVATPREAQDDIAQLLTRMYPYVRQWGGDISVSVNSPRGAVFQIFLPRIGELLHVPPHTEADASVAERHKAPLQAVPPPAPAPPPEPVNPTILIAEEDGGIRALVKKILRKQNYRVLEAESIDEALKVATEDHKLDLLIADVTNTKLDGRKLAQRLAQQFPGMKALYLSGYSEDASAQAPDVPEGAPHLQKPFTLGSLLNKVKEVLEGEPQHSEPRP